MMKTKKENRQPFRKRAINTLYVYVEASQVLTKRNNIPIEINWVPVTS